MCIRDSQDGFPSHSWSTKSERTNAPLMVEAMVAASVLAKPWGNPVSDAAEPVGNRPAKADMSVPEEASGEANPSSSSSSKGWQKKGQWSNKRKTAEELTEEDGGPPSKLKGLVKRNFLSNKWSAKDSVEVACAGTSDGAVGLDIFSKFNPLDTKHAARNMLRACLIGCAVPKLYYSAVRVLDPTTGTVKTVDLPFLLPHEVLPTILEKATQAQKDKWLTHPTRQSDVQSFCAEYKVPLEQTYPVGLHGDGVPFQAKMSDSIEQFSWSFCSDNASPRVLFCVVPKSFCAGRQTYEDILAVFVLSMKILASGHHATKRLDGQDFRQHQDAERSKFNGPLHCHACLIELRGDWAYYSAVFGFPTWNSRRLCWKCCASQHGELSFRDTGPDSAWRSRRLTDKQFEEQQAKAGVPTSIIFSAPGVKLRYVMIDWLHAMDLGVTQTVLGNCMWEVCEHLPGSTIVARVQALWFRLQAYYKRAAPTSRFQKLTTEMLKLPGKGPKLRGKAAETRNLVPFVAELAIEFAHVSRHAKLVQEVLEHLQNLYMHLDVNPFPAEASAHDCNLMCTNVVALNLEAEHNGKDKHWKVKPKIHMLQEMLEFDCIRTRQSPRLCWTYLDESWGGMVAAMAERRGGPKSAANIGITMMERYRAFVNDK